MSLLTLLDTTANGGGQSLTSGLIMIVAMIAIFYFFLIRPQKKQENDLKKMLEALKKGDKVVTIGGIHGVVSSVKENTVVVKVDDTTKIEFTKNAIAKVVTEAENAPAPAAETASTEEKKVEEPAEKPAKATKAKASKTTKAAKTTKSAKTTKENK